ncbi:MAG: choice-of-anchor J domain-containing protein [Muribaculaceae bacterium]|nr:choice-of-anchor J domain-containing protein [Muribaculaceae bacterium]
MNKTFCSLATLLVATAVCSATALNQSASPPRQSSDNGASLWAKTSSGRFATSANTRSAKAPMKVAETFTLPFYDEFDDGDATRANYTVVDLDGDGYGDGNAVRNRWFWKEDETLIQFCTDNEAKPNDWLFTPPIHLDGLNIYNLEIIVNMGARSNLKVTVGTSTDPADHREILDLNGIDESWMKAFRTDFAVESEGDYYIGFYNYSDTDSFYFNLFSIDLQAGVSSLIAAAPSGLTATPATDGLMEAVLEFTAPASMANGSPITEEEIDIEIIRNDNVAGAIKAKPGEKVVWTDSEPDNGVNNYKVYAFYNKEFGLPAATSVWVGPDQPEAIELTRLYTTDHNMAVSLEWTAATKGLHPGAYFNPDDVSYTVYRGYNSSNMEAIASGLKATSYTDNQIRELLGDMQDSYFYAVAACTAGGESRTGAQITAIGTPYTVPASESFPNGKFDIRPWLTDPIVGSFSWECMKNGSGMTAMDHDNGFSRFYSAWGGETDSRLKSPVFDISGASDPVFSVYMFHWEESSVAADNGATRMIVEISCDGGPFVALGDPLPAGYSRYGWVEHRFPLAEYKDAETVQFGLRGQTDNNWMYFYIDNISVTEQQTHDLAVEDFTGYSSLAIGDNANFRVQYTNRGLEAAEDYTVELYKDNVLVNSVQGERILPGESLAVNLGVEINASHINDENVFKAVVSYPADNDNDNNSSRMMTVAIKESFYPAPHNLSGSISDNGTELTWDRPKLPDGVTTVTDGAEDYEPFMLDGFGQWTTYDGDQLLSGYYTDLPQWPNQGSNQAFMTWSPYALEGFDYENYGDLVPYEGQACFISWLANLWVDWWTEPTNDDYLISPEVSPATEVSFFIKGIDQVSEEEYFEVMYSAGGTSVSEFTSLMQSRATGEWQKVELTLPEDARYFCIHYTGCSQMGIMVDNITYSPVTGSLVLTGYDVFRNGMKINEELVKENSYTDTGAPEGDNVYSVAAVYDRGTSNACPGIIVGRTAADSPAAGCRISATPGRLTVSTGSPTGITVWRIDGTPAVRTTVEGTESFELPRGIYIVTTAGSRHKVVL